MRLPLLAALLCAAVGASALPVYRIWRLPTEQGKPDLSLTELENGSVRFALEYTGEYPGTVDITKQEAAELGRALLEAAGQPEKVCPAPALCTNGCFTITPGSHLRLDQPYSGSISTIGYLGNP